MEEIIGSVGAISIGLMQAGALFALPYIKDMNPDYTITKGVYSHSRGIIDSDKSSIEYTTMEKVAFVLNDKEYYPYLYQSLAECIFENEQYDICDGVFVGLEYFHEHSLMNTFEKYASS
jgi:hypothetical protein